MVLCTKRDPTVGLSSRWVDMFAPRADSSIRGSSTTSYRRVRRSILLSILPAVAYRVHGVRLQSSRNTYLHKYQNTRQTTFLQPAIARCRQATNPVSGRRKKSPKQKKRRTRRYMNNDASPDRSTRVPRQAPQKAAFIEHQSFDLCHVLAEFVSTHRRLLFD